MIGTFSLGPSPFASPSLLATGRGEDGSTLGRKELGATEKPNLVPRIQSLPMPTTMDTLQDLEQQGEASILFAVPTLVLSPGLSSSFQDSSTKPPPTLTQNQFSRREPRDVPIQL